MILKGRVYFVREKRGHAMHFSSTFRLLSIVTMLIATPQVLLATDATGDNNIVTSKRYVDTRLPNDATPNLVIAPTEQGGQATKRAIVTAGTGITNLTNNSTSTDKTKIPTAYAVKEALTTATSGMITDVSGKQNKPNKENETTAAAGKVLTYTSDSLDNNVAARYIQVPVANNAPNGGSANVSTLADIWVE